MKVIRRVPASAPGVTIEIRDMQVPLDDNQFAVED
jgi:hypothetical protein